MKNIQKNKIYFLFLILFLLKLNIALAVTCPNDRSDYFCRSVEAYPNALITEQKFYLIPVKIYSLFSPQILSLPYPFVFDFNWRSPFFGAGISNYEHQYKLIILGGTTRIESFSEEAYAALVCHELGHLIGGAPYQTIAGAEWASAEGQADYFAASHCLPRYFAEKGVPSHLISAHVEKAGFDLINSLMAIEKNPNETPVRYIKKSQAVLETLINHYPTLACRYETFLFNDKKQDCWFVE